MRFDHRLALRLALLLGVTAPALQAQDARHTDGPVTIREQVTLPAANAAEPDVVFGTPRVEELVAADGSRVRLVTTPLMRRAGGMDARRPAAEPLSPEALGQRLGHPVEEAPMLESARADRFLRAAVSSNGQRIGEDEHAPFSADPYGDGGTCSPLTPGLFPLSGGLYYYQRTFQGDPAYAESLYMGVVYGESLLGYIPVSEDPGNAPALFWNWPAEAGDRLRLFHVYQYNGQTYYGDATEAAYFDEFEHLGLDGVWYGGRLQQVYHPTSPQGDYEFIFEAIFDARLVPDVAGFRVAADPDTLSLGAEAIVGIEPIDADSAVLRLPSATELTLGLGGAAGAGFGVLRLASASDPDEVEQEGEELEAITLEAVCAERITFTAEEYTPDGPPVIAATSSGDTARSGDLDPDIALLTASLVPSNWGPGGEGEGEVLLRLYPLQLLQQNDDVVKPGAGGGYLMVSKVRPDWLLPLGGSEPFLTRFGLAPFPNDTPPAPSMNDFYDPHTYRVQVFDVPDSLAATGALERVRFKYEVLRGGGVVWTSTELPLGGRQGAVLGKEPSSASSRVAGDLVKTVLRSQAYIRLVSNGPDGLGKLGSFTYDDDYRGEQTILVKLLDELRVTAYLLSEDGLSRETLGEGTFPVGQPPSQTGIDAVRFGKLVWHTYRTPS